MDDTVRLGEKSVILPDADVLAGEDLRTALANDYLAYGHFLPVSTL